MDDSFDWGAEASVVAADESLIAVYKPPRMHTAPGASGGNLCSWVFERFPDSARAGLGMGRPEAEGGLVHRLDYETSGLVLFARTAESLAFLLGEQEEGRIVKEYRALCSPSSTLEPEGSRPARHHPEGMGEEAWAEALADRRVLVAALAKGQWIESVFKPFGPGASRVACLLFAEARERDRASRRSYSTSILEAEDTERGLSLLASLALGFRHQVRAHLAWIGLPILGDPLYGGGGAGRLCLHACRLRFAHPGTGQAISFDFP